MSNHYLFNNSLAGKVLLVLGTCTLMACGGSGGGSSSSTPPPPPPPAPTPAPAPWGFSEDYHAEALAAVTISPQQKKDIAKIVDQNNSIMQLDDLYFVSRTPDTDGSEKDLQIEKNLDHFNPQGHELYDNVLKNCAIYQSNPTITGSPAQNTPMVKTVHSQVGGDNCPISLNADLTDTTSALNQASAPQANGPALQTITLTAQKILKSQESLYEQDLAANPNTIVNQTRTLEVDDNWAAFQFMTGGQVQSGTAHTKKISTGDHTMANNMAFKSTVKSEVSVIKGDAHMEALYKFEFADGRKLVVGAFSDNGSITVWVNGQQSNPQAVKHDLKIDLLSALNIAAVLTASAGQPTISSGL